MKIFIKNKYIASAFFYTGTSGLLALLPLLLLPIITIHVSASEYGSYVTYILICKVMCSVLSLGYIECLAREFSFNSKEGFSRHFTNAIYNVSIWSFIVFFVITISCRYLFPDIGLPVIYVSIICLVGYSQFIINSLLSIFQMSSRPVCFSYIKVALFSLEYSTVFVLIWLGDISNIDLLNAYVASHAIVLAFCLLYLIKNRILVLDYKPKLFGSSLRTSLPLVPHEIGGLILSFSDRFMINYFIGPSAVAVYAIGYQFGQVVSLVDTAVNKAWIPWLYKELHKKLIAKRKIIVSCLLYIVGLIVFSIVICNLGFYIIKVFYKPEYAMSAEVILYIALAFVIFGMYKVFASFLFFYKKTLFLGFATVVTVIINLLLSVYFVPKFGVLGAAYSTLISFSLLCIFVIIYLYYLLKWSNVPGVKIL